MSFYWPQDRDSFQATPAEARAFAARVLECVETAIGDAFLMRFSVEKLGIEEAAAAAASEMPRFSTLKRIRKASPMAASTRSRTLAAKALASAGLAWKASLSFGQ